MSKRKNRKWKSIPALHAQNNYAFIDSQNLHLGIQKLGWKLDYRKFRKYLLEKHCVGKAYMFLGHVERNKDLYDFLEDVGFVLKFRPITFDSDGKTKGNIDADLVLYAVLELKKYSKAILISSDGDFYSLVEYLNRTNKLEVILSPEIKHCSSLLKVAAQGKIFYMDILQEKLEYKLKKRC